MTPPPPTSGRVPRAIAPSVFLASGWTDAELVGVTATGELDIGTAPLLADEVRALGQAGPTGTARDFVLDLTDVTFLDSFGLRTVERAELVATNWGWRVRVLLPVGAEPRRLIELVSRERMGSVR